jgi:hypothetical protein
MLPERRDAGPGTARRRAATFPPETIRIRQPLQLPVKIIGQLDLCFHHPSKIYCSITMMAIGQVAEMMTQSAIDPDTS